ncbi:uncharacterized protein [Miscanthus floridulus]|uniref:uncharacterized protein n=1 Tax=Miscanthus floridulus TaxID=154761 RepID=UPI00345875C3
MDHYNLKFLLDQRLTTIPQHHWVSKPLGFDFTIEYKPGAMYTVADALSHRDTEEGAVLAISVPRDEITAGTQAAPWSLIDDMVAYDSRLYVPPASPLLPEIMTAVHEDGHEGVQRTVHRLHRDFHFPNMRRLVQDYVRACSTCQRYKSEHLHPAGLLMPLRSHRRRDSPTIRSYLSGETRVAAVAKSMADRDEFLEDIRYRLEQAQAVQKLHYDKLHRQVSYAATTGKLKPRFFGPYRVTELINEVAVRLALPPHTRLHDVFHIGLLKKFIGDPPATPPPLPVIHNGAAVLEPERAVRIRLARGVRQVLIQWKGETATSATWEDVDSFLHKYPVFQLEDELLVEGGRDVMWGHAYTRKQRARDGRRATEDLGAVAMQKACQLKIWA